MNKKKNITERAEVVLSPALTHATNVEIVKGEGLYLFDKDGNKYIDFASGIAATNVGHCNKKVVSAIEKQAKNLIHACAGVVYYEQNIALAEKLKEITPDGLSMTFFVQSGSESIETAIKLAKYVSKKQHIISYKGSFHGRTIGALSITFSNPKYHEGYKPLMPGVHEAPYPYCYQCEKNKSNKISNDDFPIPEGCNFECLKETEKIISKYKEEGIAAIFIEPIQGEGGYIVPPKEFLLGLRKLCDDNNIFLVFDEVQTGFGRTGKMFASENFGVTPDIMATAKAIASGLPLGATIAKAEIMKKWSPGAHGSTMSGNPVTCAASLATIDVIENEGLLANAKIIGKYIKEKLISFSEKYKIIGDVRGIGLMIGIEFVKPGTKQPNPEAVKEIRDLCLKEKLIIVGCGRHGNVIRLVPALNITKEQANVALNIIEKALINGKYA